MYTTTSQPPDEKSEETPAAEPVWWRVDPIFHEGTSINGRLFLQVQVISNRVARRMGLVLHALWLVVPTCVAIIILRKNADPAEFVLTRTLHGPSAALSLIMILFSAAILSRLARDCVRLRHLRWTLAQRRLVAWRASAMLLLLLAAATRFIPNLAVIIDPCLYPDSRGSLVRWCSALNFITYILFLAVKSTEIQVLYLSDPANERPHCSSLCWARSPFRRQELLPSLPQKAPAEAEAQGASGEPVWPYGQKRVPLLAHPCGLLPFTWHSWTVAIVGIGFHVVGNVLRDSFAYFDGPSCTLENLVCVRASVWDGPFKLVSGVMVAVLLVFLIVDLWRAWRRLSGTLYIPHRHTHVLVSLVTRFTSASIFVLLVSVISRNINIDRTDDDNAALPPSSANLPPSADPRACSDYALVQFGDPTVPALMMLFNVIELLLVWPQQPTQPPHECLQRFVWTDEDLPGAKAARDRAAMPMDTTAVPMFSMQRAVNLFYWMSLAYKLSNAPHLSGTIDAAIAAALRHSHKPAMACFNLKKLRIFWERRCDTKALVAWGPDAIVISWRGTNSLKNAKMDAQLARVALPGVRGEWSTRGELPEWLPGAPLGCVRSAPLRAPMVHGGFWRSYVSSGLSERLLMHVFSLLESGQVSRERCKVYVCGHSLGGALAVLCSVDLARGFGLRQDQLVVYTIGCPRVGDHAFAHYADRLVPETWHLINGHDVVTEWGKLGGLFKRNGHRVIINTQPGHLIVRPSFFENFIHKSLSSSSVLEHLPGAYFRALVQSIGKVRRLCKDPRENQRIDGFLWPSAAGEDSEIGGEDEGSGAVWCSLHSSASTPRCHEMVCFGDVVRMMDKGGSKEGKSGGKKGRGSGSGALVAPSQENMDDILAKAEEGYMEEVGALECSGAAGRGEGRSVDDVAGLGGGWSECGDWEVEVCEDHGDSDRTSEGTVRRKEEGASEEGIEAAGPNPRLFASAVKHVQTRIS